MKKMLVLASLCTVAATGWSEPQRSLLTHENKYPEYHQAEVGAVFNYTEYDLRDEESLSAYARYTILTNLTLSATAPGKKVNPQDRSLSDETGLGDIRLGLDLVAYEDIFDYPYVIPHVDVALSTGDEDKGLGTGQTVTTVGITVGTVTYECLHWIFDLSYAIDGGHEQEDPDNVVIFAGALVWDVSKKFSVLAEGKFTDENTPQDEAPAFIQGGMVYQFTENLTMGWYAGAGRGGVDNEEGSTTIKAAYTF